jgi:hypothetical protein
MEPSTLTSTVAGLLAWIGAHTSYALPNDKPAVALVPHAYLEQLACGEKCPALGVYPDGNVIYIDDALQIDTNVCAKSVLLHELVHFLQHRDDRFVNLPPEIRSYAREHEAYTVQQQYLAENGRKVAFGPNFYIGAFMGPSC